MSLFLDALSDAAAQMTETLASVARRSEPVGEGVSKRFSIVRRRSSISRRSPQGSSS